MSDQFASIAQTFEQFFQVGLVTTPEALERVYRIRYRVYCEEFGFEDPANFPDGLEIDRYDALSSHALITHRPSGKPAACVRLVPTPRDNPHAPLPLEEMCAQSLDPLRLAALGLEREKMCEISRLAVDGEFRRRSGEQVSRFGNVAAIPFSSEERRTLPFIAVSAYLAAIAMTVHTDREQVFAMMEPFLPRLLARSGIRFESVGHLVDYHGLRGPYFITSQRMLSGIIPQLRALYDVVERQMFATPARPMAANAF